MNCAEIKLNIASIIKKGFTAEDIIESVVEVSGIDRITLACPKRTRDNVEYRFIAYALLRRYTTLILKDIGFMFSRDHTTIVYGLDTHSDLLDTDPIYKNRFDQVVNHLNGRKWVRVERIYRAAPKKKTIPKVNIAKRKSNRPLRAIPSVSISRSTYNINKYAS